MAMHCEGYIKGCFLYVWDLIFRGYFGSGVAIRFESHFLHQLQWMALLQRFPEQMNYLADQSRPEFWILPASNEVGRQFAAPFRFCIPITLLFSMFLENVEFSAGSIGQSAVRSIRSRRGVLL